MIINYYTYFNVIQTINNFEKKNYLFYFIKLHIFYILFNEENLYKFYSICIQVYIYLI